MSEVFGGGYEELADLTSTQGQAADGGRRVPERAMPGEPHEGVVAIAVLNRIERELRRIRSFTQEYGRQFTRWDGAVATAGGLAVIAFEGPKSGNDWYVERLTVSASGVSAAGVLTLYQGSLGNAAVPDEGQLIDVLGALVGNSPSRGVLDGRGTPYFLYGGAPVMAVLTGVVANSSIFARLQGREVLAGADPALRPQDDF